MPDVVVIGGGPAGASASALLARLGYDVLLLEKERFPRHHIGESTLPVTLGVLETLGVMDEVRAAGFPVKRGGVYVWGRSREPWIFRFGEVNVATAFQVDRARFDDILLRHAARVGVDVREDHRVVSPVEEDGRIVGVRYLDDGGRRRLARARWVLDCSGQNAFLAGRRRTRIVNEDLKNVAIYGYWSGRRALEIAEVCAEATPEDRNSIFIETIPSGWCWWIPLAEDRFSVGAIAGPEALVGLRSDTIKEFYRERVRETGTLQRFLEGCTLEEPIRAIKDWSCRTSEFCGPGFMLVGDAAAFVDPILSTGVFLAINFGTAAASVIHTVARGLLPEALCQRWYTSVYNAVYDDYESMVRHWYFGERTQDSWFWRARRALDLDAAADFRQAFVLLASGVTHSVFRRFVSTEEDGVTFLSTARAMGCMPSINTLRRVASRLDLGLSATAPGEAGDDSEIRLVLAAREDFTLSYAAAKPDGSCAWLTSEQAERLMSAPA